MHCSASVFLVEYDFEYCSVSVPALAGLAAAYCRQDQRRQLSVMLHAVQVFSDDGAAMITIHLYESRRGCHYS